MNRIEVRYQDELVGTLAQARGGIYFEYDRDFIARGEELSPLNLPLRPGLHSRYTMPSMRLPGLFEDSLPDTWGERLMREWFRRRGTPFHELTPLMKLSYLGHRGMGALTYQPATEDIPSAQHLSILELHQAAMQAEGPGPIDLETLAEVGSSAGGAHAKALVGLPTDSSGLLLSGADDLPASHEAWIIKLDTSSDGIVGPLEEACARMARAAGIDMPPSRLLESKHGTTLRRHFAVKRFDREQGKRIHHHTLAGLTHIGGSDLDYQTLLRVTRRITQDEREVWRAYRRAVFNVLASNRDDHGKNHGFLYRDRQWRLGPAYDVTFRSAGELNERGMAICGERIAAGKLHLLKLAGLEGLDRKEALAVIDEVSSAVSRWREFADEAKVPRTLAKEVEQVIVRGLA